MSTRAQVGLSTQDDATIAGREAALAALRGLGGRAADFALMFATAGYDQPALLAAVEASLPGAVVIGCSGEGVIAGNESVEVFSAVAVMAVASDRLRFVPFLAEDYGQDSRGAGTRLGQTVLAAGEAVKCVCVMPDGLLGNCTEFLGALHAVVGSRVPVVGGTAGDAMTFERTYQYAESRVVSGGAVGFLIVGDADVEVAASHGCSPLGEERRVTSAEGGWVREIDGQPAWSLFREYLDNPTDLDAEGIVHLCIGRALEGEAAASFDPLVILTPLQLDKPTGALLFPGGGLAEGDTIQLSRRDADKIRTSAQECATRLLETHQGRRPDLVLQFDCAGRGRIMFGACAAQEIVVPLRDVLGTSTPWIGFHTYGELAPLNGRTYYHNYTVALCAVYDRAGA